MRRLLIRTTAFFYLATGLPGAPVHSIFDPRDGASLGSLNVASTDALTIHTGSGGLYRGSGGAGSGGGVILAAGVLDVTAGQVHACGADGGPSPHIGGPDGGGAGGGRIAFYSHRDIVGMQPDGADSDGLSDTIRVDGGDGHSADDGAVGTFRYSGDGFPGEPLWPWPPPPPTLLAIR